MSVLVHCWMYSLHDQPRDGAIKRGMKEVKNEHEVVNNKQILKSY